MVGAESYDPRSLATTARARRNVRARGNRAAADAALEAAHSSPLYADLGPMGRGGFGASTSAAVAAASAAMSGATERTPKLLPPAVAGGSLGITGPAPKRMRRPTPLRNQANPLDLSHLDDPDISLGPPDLALEPADARSCRKAVVATTVDSLESLPWHELHGVGFVGSSPPAHSKRSDEATASSAATAAPAPAPTPHAGPKTPTPENGATQPRRTTRASTRKQRERAAADAPHHPAGAAVGGGDAAVGRTDSQAGSSTTTSLDLKVSTFSELVHDVLNVPLPSTLPTIEELQYELREQQQRHAAQVAAFAAGHAAFAHQHYAFLGASAAATSPTGPSATVMSNAGSLPAAAPWPSPSGLGLRENIPTAAPQPSEGLGSANEDAAAADAMSAADAAATALEAAARAMAASDMHEGGRAGEGDARAEEANAAPTAES